MNPEHAHLLPQNTTRIHSHMLSFRKFACLILSVIMIANAERCPFQPAQLVAWGGCSMQGRRHHVVSSSSCWIVGIMSHRRHHGASSSSYWIIAMPFLTTLGSTDLAQPGENEHSSAQRYTSIVLPNAIFLPTRSQGLRSMSLLATGSQNASEGQPPQFCDALGR